ncbi:hypothetical protein [Nocardioides sp.]|uniref:hypothetical protein n=1 Tax=Nocardioides sp. TaxID=35761 RepID=UPI00271ED4A7|nr:hypothetical protein [Nocardioides sp.]MDO9454508.1 hypothetical protein [Nocardioides sp.]
MPPGLGSASGPTFSSTCAAASTTPDPAEFVDDLVFGVRPDNRISVGRATTSPAAGTAALPVTVPGIETASVSGPGIVGASLDSARRRTHRFMIRARGADERTLRRKVRVTVRVTMT